MGNFLFTLTVGLILYFLYGSLIFWSVGIVSAVLFFVLMFIDFESDEEKMNSSIHN